MAEGKRVGERFEDEGTGITHPGVEEAYQLGGNFLHLLGLGLLSCNMEATSLAYEYLEAHAHPSHGWHRATAAQRSGREL